MMKKRIYAALLLCLLALAFTGCGKKKQPAGRDMAADIAREAKGELTEEDDEGITGTSTVEIKKDGKLINLLEEDYGKDYYDEEGMKEFVLGEVAAYNSQAGEEAIKVKKLTLKRQKGTVTMEYASPEDFAEFNGYPFFYGSVEEAYDAGYDLDVELREAAQKGKETIGREELLQMGSRKIVIVEAPKNENLFVKTGGKILYISGAKLEKKNVAAVSDKTAYIVFK